MIPEIVHQLWIDPHGQRGSGLPPDIERNRAAWRTFHKSFQFRVWQPDDLLRLCEAHERPEIAAAIMACRFPAMQADLGRLLVLELFGGFWIDLRLHPLVPFLDQLLSCDLVVTEHFPKDNLPEPNGFLINGFIGAAPAHPCIRAALRSVAENVARRMSGSIFYVTGSTNLLKAVQAASDRGAFRMLGHRETWGRLFELRGGSYNAGGMHWSERQERESPYRD